MTIKDSLDKLQEFLKKYNLVVGLVVIILLATLCVMTYMNFDKQNQIIETGGFTDGKIKCVCSEEAWTAFMVPEDIIGNISEVIVSSG
jgi:citrate lyase synthetase